MRCSLSAVRRSFGTAVFAVLLLLPPLPGAGPARLPERRPGDRRPPSARQALAGTRAYEIVRSLTVEVGPRPAGSKAYDAAVEWGLRKMKDARLQQRPCGEGDRARTGCAARSRARSWPPTRSRSTCGPRRQRRHPGGGDRGAGDRGLLPGGGRQARSRPGQGEDRLLQRPHEADEGRLRLRRRRPRARRGRLGGGEARRGGGAHPLDRDGQQPHPAHRGHALRGRGGEDPGGGALEPGRRPPRRRGRLGQAGDLPAEAGRRTSSRTSRRRASSATSRAARSRRRSSSSAATSTPGTWGPARSTTAPAAPS